MGLFNSKSAKDWADEQVSFEKALLANNSDDKIVRAGLSGLVISGERGLNFCAAAGKKLKEYFELNLNGFKLKDKLKWVSAYELFSIAEEAGAADAAFCLGVIHEHGLCGWEQDQVEANNHYNLAAARGSRLAAALSYIKADHMKTNRDMSTDQYESLAINMNCACWVDSEDCTAVRQMLKPEDIQKLLQISTYLLFFYASKSYPQSLAIMFTMLSSNNQMVEKGMIHRYFHTEDFANTIAQRMGQKVWMMAKAGDSRAIAACMHYKIVGN